MRTVWRCWCFLLLIVLNATGLRAQTASSQPITLVVPWAAGGAADAVARAIARDLSTEAGRPVIIENVPGAGGTLGVIRVLKAPADGNTLLLSSPVETILSPLSYKSASYGAKDLRAVAMLGRTGLALVVRKDLPVGSVADLVALMRARAERPLVYCSPAVGSPYDLAALRLDLRAGTRSVHVPYLNLLTCLNDMVGGQVDFAFVPIAGPFPGLIDAGMVRAIAVTAAGPNARLPRLPLLRDSAGFEDLNLTLWAGVHVSSRTDNATAAALNRAINVVLARPDVRRLVEASGGAVEEPNTSTDAQAFYMREIERFEAMAHAAGQRKP